MKVPQSQPVRGPTRSQPQEGRILVRVPAVNNGFRVLLGVGDVLPAPQLAELIDHAMSGVGVE